MIPPGSHYRMLFSRKLSSSPIASLLLAGLLQPLCSRSLVATLPIPGDPPETETWSQPVRELAAKIVALTGTGVNVSLNVRNASSLEASAVAEVSRALHAELIRQGLRLPNGGQPQAGIRVTLSQNIQGLVWVAEVISRKESGAGDAVTMISVSRRAPELQSRNSMSVVIRRSKLWEDDEPILDVAFLDMGADDSPLLLVLGRFRVSLLWMQNGRWRSRESASLVRAPAWPRDPRGQIIVQPPRSFVAYVPGARCEGDAQPALTVSCRPDEQGWPLEARAEPGADTLRAPFAAARNFFEGRLNLAEGREMSLAPFFSAVPVPARSNPLWLSAGLDGRALLISATHEMVAAFEGWGSDIAAVKSSCGRGWQVLATGNRDDTERDVVRAFEISGQEAIPESPALEFEGPITALWSHGDGSSATAASRNLATGKYEAFSLSVACNQ